MKNHAWALGTSLAFIGATLLTGVTATPAFAQTQDGSDRMKEAIAAADAGRDPLPGPRSCFWSLGPVSADPYMNVAYPDAGTFYWGAVFTVPDNATLTLQGQFPHSRYMAVASYDEAGRPNESIADYLIQPDQGSTNPFVQNANREASRRAYTLKIVDGQPDPGQKTGMDLVGEHRDTLHAPKYGKGQQALIYRIYVNDNGRDETGGAGLPVPVLTYADGKVLKGPAACVALSVKQRLAVDPAALAVPMEKYAELLAAAAKVSPTFPATSPATWYQQIDRRALYGIYNGDKPGPDARKSVGGFYPNLDNQYIRTILNRKLGKVFVIRGKAPTTPHTENGDAAMGTGELRYWSFCSNQGFANTRVNACVHDEEVPVDAKGFYTIVVSRVADRPRNAIKACGVAWLPMADDGDGSGDPDVTVLQLRHMLGTGNFPHSVQAIGKLGDEEKDMGAYFPHGQYVSTSGFELALPCQIEKR